VRLDELAKVMKTKTRSLRVAAVGLTLLAATCAAASAERYALLIGIGSYPQLYDLAGPRNDVEALAEELVGSWGFPPENVRRLVDSEATKRAILDAVDRLLAETEPGDHVLVYYSGHGTSGFDGDARRGEGLLGEWTGALMPYDYAAGLPPSPTPSQWSAGLIVGRRDLEPRLARLDRDRDVFVIFDTCLSPPRSPQGDGFSGRDAGSVAERAARWVSPPPFAETDGKTRGFRVARDAVEARAHPYRKLIYLEAAPTDSLLAALANGAGRDARPSYSELFARVREDAAERGLGRPRLFVPEAAPGLASRPVFDHDPRLPGPARALLDLAYPRPDFALRLELPALVGEGRPRRGVLYRGEGFEIAARADPPAVFLLVNVDRTGAVSVLYPAEASELAPATEIREAFDVVPPYGTDNLKLFAFGRPPAGLADWIDRQVEADDPRIAELLELLARPDGQRAEARLEVVTSERGRTR
jgi:hypothetical protein